MRSVARSLFLLGFLLLPTFAYAQTTLAGVVRDASGGVLPGVTVEASSPALIEKVRSAVTDGSGQYRITDLPPGTYSVAYTLPGFSKVVRDGLTLSGSGAITIDIELRVGGLEETLTVTGETPVVDVQTTRRETVLSNEVIQSMPVTRSYTGIMTQHRVADADRRRRRGDEPGPDQPLHGAWGPPERRTHLGQRSAGDRAGRGRGRLVAGLRRGQRG